MYLAQRVDVDPGTRNLTLVECFRGLRVPHLPGVSAPFFVVAYLASGAGEFPFVVSIERMDTLAEVYRASARLSFPNRLEEVRFKLKIENCLFSTEGEYCVTLWIGGEMIAQTPFRVRLAQ
jgi:hypothetical protein